MQGRTAGSIVLTNADPLVAVAPFPFMYRSSIETQRTAVAVGHSTQANDPTHGHPQTRTSPQVSMFLFGFHIGKLVGGLNPSEKYYIVNWDYYSQYMET